METTKTAALTALNAANVEAKAAVKAGADKQAVKAAAKAWKSMGRLF